MKFSLSNSTKRANERVVGMSCAKQSRMPFEKLCGKDNSHSTKGRSIKPRGSVYLQLGRKNSMIEVWKTIKTF